MTVNLTGADKALKAYYLDAVAEQLNMGVHPFMSAIEKTTSDVWGKEIRKLAVYGINGGIGAGTEDGVLPTAVGNNYENFVLSLKNLYGTIEISDKAIRASENNAGAFVNLLNAEMEGLIKSSKFNFSRMLFGDGTGAITKVVSVDDKGNVIVESVAGIKEGMYVDFMNESGNTLQEVQNKKVIAVDREKKSITLSGSKMPADSLGVCNLVTLHNSWGKEITGLKAIFNNSGTLYGLDRSTHKWLCPYIQEDVGEIDEMKLQTAIDSIEEFSGNGVNFIVCSMGVRRALMKAFAKSNANIDTLELAGGFKAISYNGIPIVADRFCDAGTLYLLNTNDFALHQLCDWQWLEGEDGSVLKQVAGKPVYTATLVKYADMICSKPCGQGVLRGITEE